MAKGGLGTIGQLAAPSNLLFTLTNGSSDMAKQKRPTPAPENANLKGRGIKISPRSPKASSVTKRSGPSKNYGSFSRGKPPTKG